MKPILEELYKSRAKYVSHVCALYIRNPQDVEDAAGGWWLWLTENLSKYDESRGTFKKWFDANLVYYLLTLKTYNKMRAHASIYDADGFLIHELPDTTHVETVDAAMTRAAVLDALSVLSKAKIKLDDTLTMKKLENHIQIYKGKEILKRALKRRGVVGE